LAAGRAVLCLPVSASLSGAASSAAQAAALRAGAAIAVLDCGWAGMALGFVALAAARAATGGTDLEGVRAAAIAESGRVGQYGVLDTLAYLRRGGRIGRAGYLAAALLEVKPILRFERGTVRVAGLARTKRRALRRMADHVLRDAGEHKIDLAIQHAACTSEAVWTAGYLRAHGRVGEVVTADFPAATGAHIGPGAVAVAYRTVEG
jgi:DegV family protein with EDD domain